MWPPMPAPYMLGQQQAQQQRSRRGGKSKISADGPVYDQNNTSIVVEGIPDDHLSDTQVLSFFAQFGTVVSVDLQPRKKLATVKYETWAEANAAYMSPKVIFDNRFVKVFWYKEGGPDKGKTGSAPSNGDGDDEAGSPSAAPEFDMEEFLRKQEEAQKIFEEKMRKKQELDKRRQELEELQRDLLARQREERQKLVSKIALVATRAKRAQSGEDTGGTDASSISTSATGGITAPTQTEIIRAQLAALEEEAKQLGLDPDAILGGQLTSFSGSDKPPTASSFWSGRARGGTYSRGRGAFASRGRGRGGGAASSIAAAYAAYSLDNRPRRVAVTGVNFQMPENGEALRQHLLVSWGRNLGFLTPATFDGYITLTRLGNWRVYSLEHDRGGGNHNLCRPAHRRGVLLQPNARHGCRDSRGGQGTRPDTDAYNVPQAARHRRTRRAQLGGGRRAQDRSRQCRCDIVSRCPGRSRPQRIGRRTAPGWWRCAGHQRRRRRVGGRHRRARARYAGVAHAAAEYGL